MSDDSQVSLGNLEDASIADMLAFLSDLGYSTDALSNEEVFDLCVAVVDGHKDEGPDVEDLDFSMDFKQEAYHGD